MPSKKRKHTPPSGRPPPHSPDKAEQRRFESRNEDMSLIQEALAGDQNSFSRLRQKYHDAIFNLIYRMIREKDEVKDLTQEAFIKAFGSLPSFNNEYAFSTWVRSLTSSF